MEKASEMFDALRKQWNMDNNNLLKTECELLKSFIVKLETVPAVDALNKLEEAIKVIKEVELFVKVNHNDSKAYGDSVKDFVAKYPNDFKKCGKTVYLGEL